MERADSQRCPAEPWQAWRLDNQQCLKTCSAAELRAAMISDHSIQPVRAADLSPSAGECRGTGALMPERRPRWRA